MSYDFTHDYFGRFRDCYCHGDLTGLVVIGMIFGLFQLFGWIFGQIWFWLCVIPAVIGTVVITWKLTHNKAGAFLLGMEMAILLPVLFAVLT